MTWMDRFKSLIRHFLAVQLREIVRHRTASALDRLDERLLADIGVPRSRIAEYAREIAQMSVPVPPMPTFAHKGITERLRSWRKRRATIRELCALDDRLLRDIGIEPGRIGDVVDAVLSRRSNPVARHPVVQLSDVMQEILVPARNQSRTPAARPIAPDTPARAVNGNTTSADWTANVHALRTRAANESESPERRLRAAGM